MSLTKTKEPNADTESVTNLIKVLADNIENLSDTDCARIDGYISGIAANAEFSKEKQ